MNFPQVFSRVFSRRLRRAALPATAMWLVLLCPPAGLSAQDQPEPPPPTAETQQIAVEDTVDDAAIERRLRGIFETLSEYSDSSYQNVDIKVRNGVARVTGEVATALIAEKVEQKVANTEGIVFVENKLEVLGEVDIENTVDVIYASLRNLWRDFLSRLPLLAAAMIAIVLTAVAAKLIGWLLSRSIFGRARVRQSLQDLISQLVNISVWIIGLLIAAVIAFPGMTPSKALTVLGLGSVAIGFAFKDIFENFFAGILILWKYPFDRGDFVQCADLVGCVEEITIRNTMIRQLDGELAVVPNAVLFKETVHVLTNERYRRVRIVCGVAYDEDIDESRTVIEKAVRACVTVEGERLSEVFAMEFADSSLNFEVSWWTGSRPGDIRRSRDEVVAAIKRALDDAGIEIPFPYRTLTFKNADDASKIGR